jgi:hypothetical protein
MSNCGIPAAHGGRRRRLVSIHNSAHPISPIINPNTTSL